MRNRLLGQALSFPEKDSLYYLYTLKNFKQGPDDVIGIAHMTFFAIAGRGKRFFDGQGYFLDKNSEAKEVHYTFERVDKRMLRDMIGKTSIATTEDRRKFLREYSKRSAAAVKPASRKGQQRRSRRGPPHGRGLRSRRVR
jgi:hypothetical protein